MSWDWNFLHGTFFFRWTPATVVSCSPQHSSSIYSKSVTEPFARGNLNMPHSESELLTYDGSIRWKSCTSVEECWFVTNFIFLCRNQVTSAEGYDISLKTTTFKYIMVDCNFLSWEETAVFKSLLYWTNERSSVTPKICWNFSLIHLIKNTIESSYHSIADFLLSAINFGSTITYTARRRMRCKCWKQVTLPAMPRSESAPIRKYERGTRRFHIPSCVPYAGFGWWLD